jgi:hypothetical protein
MARPSRAQKSFSNSGLDFKISIDEVLEALAAGYALTDSMKDKRYLDAIVDEAFELADESFNLQAAAYASTGAIRHMYEWGTLGVNKGRSNVRLNPNNPAARLWTNFAEGAGLDRTLWFAYRPSVANVPKPTVASTGMSSETIAKMRDHVFRWKAEVMEEGQDVTIKPRKAKFLLIPAYEENRPYMRPNDIKRGYMLTKGPVTVNPGQSTAYGNFTAFWTTFWAGEGAEILNDSVNSQILSDYEPEFRKPRTNRSLRPVGTMDVKREIEAKSKKIQKKVRTKAHARRAK